MLFEGPLCIFTLHPPSGCPASAHRSPPRTGRPLPTCGQLVAPMAHPPEAVPPQPEWKSAFWWVSCSDPTPGPLRPHEQVWSSSPCTYLGGGRAGLPELPPATTAVSLFLLSISERSIVDRPPLLERADVDPRGVGPSPPRHQTLGF